jgi:propionyl-CoA carboxylase beta chain
MDARVEQLGARRDLSRLGGGEEGIDSQREQSKLTVRERLDILLDPGSFVELDAFVTHRGGNFRLDEQCIPDDDVVTRPSTGGASSCTARTSPCSMARCPRRTLRRLAR